ncbi:MULTISPECIES: tetratricopeptide repeat protein [unclassified Tychonema]|uniref:tetratricopeptide repeat protein n=1 Tax=unclassified Tychonema TaxID=2642144 RepID=UPI00187E93CD|nr:tetratricopeptide repeat protein [Tychonema sp. LEGE 07196]
MVELISVHVPKTAGTTFSTVLNQVYGEKNIYLDYMGSRPGKYGLSKLPPEIRVVHGHFLPFKYDHLYPQAKKIIWVRNPIYLVISLYFYWLYVPLGSVEKQQKIVRDIKKKTIGLDDFVERPEAKNLISKYSGGKTLTNFDFVGVQEFIEEDLAYMQTMLKWPDFNFASNNSNPNPKYKQDLEEVFANTKLIENIIKNNQEDLEIYQEALRLRAERRKELLLIQPIRVEWNRSQSRLKKVLKEVKQQAEIELAQAKSELCMVKAELFLEKNQLDEALTACEQAIKIKPEFALACLTMGNIWSAKGQANKAKNCYDMAVSIQPTLVEALENLGNICMEEQLWSEAITCYQKLLIVQPSVGGVYRNLATALYNENKLEESANCMYVALTLDSEKSTALDYFNLGNSFLNQNLVERAIICYRRAVYLDPSFSEAHRILGAVMT